MLSVGNELGKKKGNNVKWECFDGCIKKKIGYEGKLLLIGKFVDDFIVWKEACNMTP